MFQNKEHVSKIVAASLGFAQEMLWEAVPFQNPFLEHAPEKCQQGNTPFWFFGHHGKGFEKNLFRR
ncbi:MAG TPA: hypothetical protein VK129_07025 [Terriglobales bacterium]|nr:hypothetical protein [Terriglobales bacterium]